MPSWTTSWTACYGRYALCRTIRRRHTTPGTIRLTAPSQHTALPAHPILILVTAPSTTHTRLGPARRTSPNGTATTTSSTGGRSPFRTVSAALWTTAETTSRTTPGEQPLRSRTESTRRVRRYNGEGRSQSPADTQLKTATMGRFAIPPSAQSPRAGQSGFVFCRAILLNVTHVSVSLFSFLFVVTLQWFVAAEAAAEAPRAPREFVGRPSPQGGAAHGRAAVDHRHA